MKIKKKRRKTGNNGNSDGHSLSGFLHGCMMIHSYSLTVRLEHVEVIAFDDNTNSERSVSSVLSRAIKDGLPL